MNESISTHSAPKAIGPYSQAVRAGGFLYVSGTIPLDPETGVIVAGGIEEQALRVLKNLGAVLEAAGMGFSDVVKTTVFLTDLGNFSVINDLYARFFNGPTLPARAAVQVVALPKGALIEIEAVAYQETRNG